jgi:dienelactone hydrolase
LPLVLHFAGHWGGGAESEEMLPGGALLAASGRMVVLLPLRGEERGADDDYRWRAAHFSRGEWADARVRRAGRTPIGWDVDAARAVLSMLRAGGAGARVAAEGLTVMGFSGGAERALTFAMEDGAVHDLVLGASELAFGTQGGMAFCACGAVPGARDDLSGQLRFRRWLEAAPVRRILWFVGEEEEKAAAGLRPKGELHLRTGAGHGLGTAEHRVLLSLWGAPDDRQIPILDVPRHARLDWPLGAPGPGAADEEDLGPGGQGAATLAGIRQALAWPSEGPVPGPPAERPAPDVKTIAPAAKADHGWLVFTPRDPLGPGTLEGEPIPYGVPWPTELPGPEALAALDPAAHWTFLTPAFPGGHGEDLRAARIAAEGGPQPLALAVSEVLAWKQRVAGAEHLRPDRVGLVGLGGGGVAVMLAAALSDDAAAVVLLSAPIRLGGASPRSGDRGAPLPWPLWTVASVPGGLAVDPSAVAPLLGERLLWWAPRAPEGGNAAPTGGRVESTLAAAFSKGPPGPAAGALNFPGAPSGAAP